jgi:hypothetical protein
MARSPKRRDGGKKPKAFKSPTKAKKKSSPKIRQNELEKAIQASIWSSYEDYLKRDTERAILESLKTTPVHSPVNKESNINETIALTLSRSASADANPVEYEVSEYTDDNILETGGGGACLFKSLAYELNRLGFEFTHYQVRNMICDEIERLYNNGGLLPILETIYGVEGGGFNIYRENLKESMKADTFEEAMLSYIEYMRKLKSWGSELEFTIFQTIFPELNLLIFRESKGDYVVQPFPWHNNTTSGQYVRLFANGVHFQVIEDDSDRIRDPEEQKRILKLVKSNPVAVKKSPKKKK